MAMIYTLVSSAKEWLSERYGQDACPDNAEEEEAAKDEVIVPHGEPVTVDTFSAWRERFEAELALERAKLIPESALTAPKEKKLIGRQCLKMEELKGASPVREGYDEEDEEDIDLDNNDFEGDGRPDYLVLDCAMNIILIFAFIIMVFSSKTEARSVSKLEERNCLITLDYCR
ncbi:hypothetical protein ES332_A05G143700v1 [Gossypium tomentosum]|uniref:RWD domain-containing protein n=1 Tax=Gossypium tomentosum TaxID=34277 RepID=A0A5D2QEJ8_GOSTO|nr:hypothetical protein ES332_A05G143700v1 [Gossypium tomentosum]